MEDPKDSSSEDDEYIATSGQISDILADLHVDATQDSDTFRPEILQDLVIEEDEAEAVGYEEADTNANSAIPQKRRWFLSLKHVLSTCYVSFSL